MNSVKAISQLEDLKKDRLSFVHNNELDEVFLQDIKAISLAIKALKKHPDDTKTQEEVIVPLILSIDVTKMLVESAINSGLKVIVESVTN